MCDIIATICWQCGDNDCGIDGGWHQANYWIYDDGTYSCDNFSDGDHDPCDEEDIPTWDEISAAWKEYSAWVLEHGTDPLGEFIVAGKSRRKTVKYRAWFQKSVLGWLLVDVQRGGKRISLSDMPRELVEYLNVTKKNDRLFFDGDEPLEQYDGVFTRKGLRFNCPVEFTIEPTPECAARALRAAARRHLKQKA